MTSRFPDVSIPAELGMGDERIVIAVLDGAVDRSHPVFDGARLRSLPPLVAPTDIAGRAARHGTHVASVIFGQPDSAVTGIAPRSTGVLIPIFSDQPDGAQLACSQLDLARAIDLALAKPPGPAVRHAHHRIHRMYAPGCPPPSAWSPSSFPVKWPHGNLALTTTGVW